MKSLTNVFTNRQYMATKNYEFFHYKDNSTREVDFHNHDFFEIYFFLSGKVTYMIEANSITLMPGDILLIPNYSVHKPVISESEIYERIVIWVSPDFLQKHSTDNSSLFLAFKSKEGPQLIRPYTKTYSEIRSILTKLEEAFHSVSYGSSILKNTYLAELLVYLNKAYIEGYEEENLITGSNDKISNVINYINNNIEDDLSLNTLSNIFYTSKYHLSREFKKYTGFTLHNFVTRKRLLKARDLLAKGYNISDVCIKSGYNDYSNFIRSFKNFFGLPPKKFSKKFDK